MTQQKSFVLYDDYFELIKFLTIEQRGDLITMIFQYAATGEEMKNDDTAVRIVFSSIRMTMDRDREKYQQRCEANKENGKKGGRPKKSEKTEWLLEKAKKPDNDNDNENENENENDIENGGENEYEYDTRMGTENDRAPRGVVSPPPTEPPLPLSEKDKEELRRNGVPESYAEERLTRAEVFARSQKKRVVDILLNWWQTDRYGTPSNQKASIPAYSPWQSSSKSYDVDEFIEAALRRSEEEMRELYEADLRRERLQQSS